MTSTPADLLEHRKNVRRITGLGAVEVGISPDPAHLRTNGYHVGIADIAKNGRYHGPATANVGSSTEDYSVRQLRDRQAGGNTSSAVDVGDNWPIGGRAAWLRFNNLLYREMRDRPQNLPALRAINVALDGRTKQRYDQHNRADGLIASKDTVDSHTHLEFWRNTEGRRAATLARIEQLMQAAANNTAPESVEAGDDDMANSWTEPLTQGPDGIKGQPRDNAMAYIWVHAHNAAQGVARLEAEARADRVRDDATLAAVQALGVATGADMTPVLDSIQAVYEQARAGFSRIAELESRLGRIEGGVRAGLSSAELEALLST